MEKNVAAEAALLSPKNSVVSIVHGPCFSPLLTSWQRGSGSYKSPGTSGLCIQPSPAEEGCMSLCKEQQLRDACIAAVPSY